jgi:metal-sulfur cluster biosynthetic enzyme
MEPQADTIDRDILDALRDISDPEIGVSVVDLGLVYSAERTSAGIHVAMTMTTPSCPVSDMLIGDVRDALRRQFPETPGIDVVLVWDPPWSPARMNDAARSQLGWRPKPASQPAPSWTSRFFGSLTRH